MCASNYLWFIRIRIEDIFVVGITVSLNLLCAVRDRCEKFLFSRTLFNLQSLILATLDFNFTIQFIQLLSQVFDFLF